MNIIIAETDDSVLVAGILNRAFATVAQQFNFTQENAPRFPAFIGPEAITAQLVRGLKMYCYRINNETAGCIGYTPLKDRIYLIERLAVLPEYRHSGIGKKLMQFAERQIVKEGGNIAEAHIVDINTELVEWYKKLKYNITRIEVLKSAPFDSYVMNKELHL